MKYLSNKQITFLILLLLILVSCQPHDTAYKITDTPRNTTSTLTATSQLLFRLTEVA